MKVIPQRIYIPLHDRLASVLVSVATSEPVVALTFDDGPHPVATPRLLEILARHGARGTFFMVGRTAQRYPVLVQRVVAGGHALGNHTWDHPSLPLLPGPQRRQQIRACAHVLPRQRPRLFRPPYGDLTIAAHLDVMALGYRVIAWNIAGYDWLDHDADWMRDHILSALQPGSIILLHDGMQVTLDQRYLNREPMLQAVDTLLEELRGRYRFVTVPELLRTGRARLRFWQRLPDREFLARMQPVAQDLAEPIQIERIL